MKEIREVKKSFCLLSVAYLVLGLLLLIWPDISVRTFCYVFGVGMLIFGGAHLILYFVRDKYESVLQMDMVAGIVGIATGAYILLKMEYMLEIIPFALGIVALLGAAVKVQDAFDLKRLKVQHWYLMLLLAVMLVVLGALLISNPFEGIEIIVKLIGISLIVDGIGNLIGIFWIALVFRKLKKVIDDAPETKDVYDVITVEPDQKESGEIAESTESAENIESNIVPFPGESKND